MLLFCAIHVVLETIKQHRRILMLKQNSTGNMLKNQCKNPGASWTMLIALPRDCGGGGGALFLVL